MTVNGVLKPTFVHNLIFKFFRLTFQIGAFAAPDKIHWAPGLPKTRSGKIMRRILRKIASRQLEELGDTSTLADPNVVDQLIQLADCWSLNVCNRHNSSIRGFANVVRKSSTRITFVCYETCACSFLVTWDLGTMKDETFQIVVVHTISLIRVVICGYCQST